MGRKWISRVHFCSFLDLTAVAAVLLACSQPTTQVFDTARAMGIENDQLFADAAPDRLEPPRAVHVNLIAPGSAKFLQASLTLLASRPAFGHGLLRQLQPPGQTTKVGEKIAETRKVVIRLVRKADGQPIARAIVVVTSFYYTDRDGFGMETVADDEQAEQITDNRGCCVIEAPGAASGVSILLGKEGFTPVLRTVHWQGKTVFEYETAEGWKRQEVPEGTVPTLTHELAPGEVVGGLVKDTEGRPIEGAELTVAFGDVLPGPGNDGDSLTPSFWSVHGDIPYLRVKTDADGRWRTSSLPTGPPQFFRKSVIFLRLSHPQYVSENSSEFQRQLSLRTARAMTSVLVMKPGLSVAGQVRDSQGKPVPGARVVLGYSTDSADFFETKTDAIGRFVFPHVNEKPRFGGWTVNVDATGFAPAWKTTSPDSKPLEFSLTPAKPFHGRVVDRQGLPVAAVKVSATCEHFHHLVWRAVTDGNGLFVWPEPPREGDIKFDLHKPGHGHAYATVSAKLNQAHLTFDPK